MDRFPPGTERVEIAVAEGVSLRGVFVPADDGAPVVLHLLGGGDSVSYGTSGVGGHWFFRDLRDLGLASLCVDYRGVGPSDGERSPLHLAPDAAAAYAEAVRRAGGSERVVVRGVSLGTVAAASLLTRPDAPGGAILVAPVRAETVAVNYAYHHWPDPLVWVLAPLFGPAGDVDVIASIAACRIPLAVAAPERDVFLPPDETALVRAAADAAGARWIPHRGLDHYDIVAEWMHVTREEEEFLASILPGVPPAEGRAAAAMAALDGAGVARFTAEPAAERRLLLLCGRHSVDPPRLAAALALTGAGGDEAHDARLLRWLRRLPPLRIAALPFDALVALVSLQDPAGPLDPRELAGFARTGTGDEILGGTGALPERAVRIARAQRLDRVSVYEGVDERSHETFTLLSGLTRVDGDRGPVPEGAPARLSLRGADRERQTLRLALKLAGVPDRVVPGEGGDPGIEVFDGGRWRPLEPPVPAGAAAPE